MGKDAKVSSHDIPDVPFKVSIEYKKLRNQVSALHPNDASAVILIDKSKSEIDLGNFPEARSLLRQAASIQVAAAQEAGKLQALAKATADNEMLQAADSTASEGQVYFTQRDFLNAAATFAEAANLVPAEEENKRVALFIRQGDALVQQGIDRGDNDALEAALKIFRGALGLVKQGDGSLLWAKIQDNIANTFGALGSRQKGTDELQAALTADQHALQEVQHSQDHRLLAQIQSHRGEILRALGERQNTSQSFEQALIAFDSALVDQNIKDAPLDWARTKMRIGTLLVDLGLRATGEAGSSKFEQAIATLDEALKSNLIPTGSSDWAQTVNSIGNAQRALGERLNDKNRLSQAASSFRTILKYLDRKDAPLLWGAAEANLGTVLMDTGCANGSSEELREAVQSFEAALQENKQERTHLDWAKTFGNAGVAKGCLANATQDTSLAYEAYKQIDEALTTTRQEGDATSAQFYFNQENAALSLYLALSRRQ